MSENDLIVKAQNGDSDVENELLKEYIPLVKTVVRSYYVIGVDDDDLLQVGMIGLMNAIRKFDVGNGTASFKTYASTCIHNKIKTHLRKSNSLKESTPLSEIENMPDDQDVVQLYEAKETERLLFEAISGVLSDMEMSVLKLYLSAMSYKEIATKLGLETKKVDNTLAATKRKIKKLLEKE